MKDTMYKLLVVLAFVFSAGAARASTTLPYGTSFTLGAQAYPCTVTGTSPYVSCSSWSGIGSDGDVACDGLTTADEIFWSDQSPTTLNCWFYTGTAAWGTNGWFGFETPEPYNSTSSTGYHRCVAEVSLAQTSDAYRNGWTSQNWPQGSTVWQDQSTSNTTNPTLVNNSPDKDEYMWIGWAIPSGASLSANSTYGVHIMCPIKPDTVSNLPACSSANAGMIRSVTDNATAVSYNGAVTGSGSTLSTVMCDGTNWKQR